MRTRLAGSRSIPVTVSRRSTEGARTASQQRRRAMRKVIVGAMVSLDGVMQAPGGPEEDPTGGFELGGWGVKYFDDEMMGRVAASGPYELLLGRGTYEIFAAHWPYDEGPIADQLNRTRKHVASTTLKSVEWSN